MCQALWKQTECPPALWSVLVVWEGELDGVVEAWEVTGSGHSGLSIKEDKTVSAVEEMSLAKEKRK